VKKQVDKAKRVVVVVVVKVDPIEARDGRKIRSELVSSKRCQKR